MAAAGDWQTAAAAMDEVQGRYASLRPALERDTPAALLQRFRRVAIGLDNALRLRHPDAAEERHLELENILLQIADTYDLPQPAALFAIGQRLQGIHASLTDQHHDRIGSL